MNYAHVVDGNVIMLPDLLQNARLFRDLGLMYMDGNGNSFIGYTFGHGVNCWVCSGGQDNKYIAYLIIKMCRFVYFS